MYKQDYINDILYITYWKISSITGYNKLDKKFNYTVTQLILTINS